MAGRGTRTASWIAGVTVLLLVSACGQEGSEPPKPSADAGAFTVVDYAAVPGWRDDTLAEALPAVRRSCTKLAAMPRSRRLGPKGIAGEAGEWQEPCQAAAALGEVDGSAARVFFETWFTPVKVAPKKGRHGLFTGYYEAELKGARWPGGRYSVPLYKVPDNLVVLARAASPSKLKVGRMEDGKLVPYYSRAEIEAGALDGRNDEILWVDDAVDAFFLHIQGSGRIVMPDGRVTRVGYAGNNGYKFYGIGQALLDSGEVPRDKMSMQSIRDWLRANPVRARELMNKNPRYIFFREIEGDGPIGAAGVALTPGRSLAVDASELPYHVPVWLDSTFPSGKRPLRRLLVAQDTGTAIKGRVRGDVFWGYGEPALEIAGGMKQQGDLYLLLPKPVAARLVPTT
jgi:membrane-bound lytic murein transglycosylase A